MLILFELIVLLSCVNCLSFTGDYTSNLRTNDSLCLNPPPLCTCNDDVYSCSLVNSQDKAVIKIYYNNEWIVFQCLNLSSFETAPDLTNYINITDIRISKCMLSNRNTLIKLTSKISKQVKDLSMSFTVKEKLTLNKTAFEGFSKLQHLKIQFNSFRSMQISNDVFEHLVNLKKLTLVSVQTPNGLFDPLKHLQILSIKSNQMKLEIDIFKNQRNLIELNFYCEMNCSMDPFIFANITNLEDLEIIGNFSMNPENVLKNNEKLKSFKLSFSFQRHQFTQKLLAQKNHLRYVDFNHNNLETLPIDIFKNLSNIDKIILSSNQLITLSNDLFMDQTMLSELDLGYNNLTELHDGLFETTKNIKILILTSNLLTNISR